MTNNFYCNGNGNKNLKQPQKDFMKELNKIRAEKARKNIINNILDLNKDVMELNDTSEPEIDITNPFELDEPSQETNNHQLIEDLMKEMERLREENKTLKEQPKEEYTKEEKEPKEEYTKEEQYIVDIIEEHEDTIKYMIKNNVYVFSLGQYFTDHKNYKLLFQYNPCIHLNTNEFYKHSQFRNQLIEILNKKRNIKKSIENIKIKMTKHKIPDNKFSYQYLFLGGANSPVINRNPANLRNIFPNNKDLTSLHKHLMNGWLRNQFLKQMKEIIQVMKEDGLY